MESDEVEEPDCVTDTCPRCGAAYRHIQHPAKPAGVIMWSACDCEYVVTADGASTIVTVIPPNKSSVLDKSK